MLGCTKYLLLGSLSIQVKLNYLQHQILPDGPGVHHMSYEGVGNLSRNLLSLSVTRCLAENCEAVEGRGLQTAPQPVRVHKHIIIHLEDILDSAASVPDPLEEEGCLGFTFCLASTFLVSLKAFYFHLRH